VSRRDGRAIEEALASSFFAEGILPDGAVIEASYAVDDPPLLKRLREERIPRVLDPQTLRFTGERYLSVDQLRKLPFAPTTPITADGFLPTHAVAMARAVLLFEQ